jgi:branched-chain amino acid transport system ATP-binding protein
VLLLDEPLAGLSAGAADRLFGLIERERRGGAAVVWVEYGPAPGHLASRLLELEAGQIRFFGTPAEWEAVRRAVAMRARLQVQDLAGGYQDVPVFSGVSFSVESGEALTILGANGSGKSSLLETLQGLVESTAGVILLEGEPVQDLAPEMRTARGMSLVSDRRRLWKEMTVAEHLRIGAFRAAARHGWRSRALQMYGLFSGLPERRRTRPAGLSGGLQQQLALARFGMSLPSVWLLDDPLRGLDELMTGRVLDWIRAGVDAGAAVILTGQNVRTLLDIATKAMFLGEGSLQALPPGAEGLRDPRVSQLLLGAERT